MRKPIPNIPDYDRVKKYAEYWRFVQWMGTPSPLRKPGNQRDFARENSMHENQLGRWKRMPEFRRDVDRAVSEYLADYTSDVGYALLTRIFKEGSAAEVRLFREWAHEWMPSLRLEVEDKTGQPSEELIRKLADEFEQKLRETLTKNAESKTG